MNTRTLGGPLFDAPDPKAARRTDPVTSHLADRAHTRSGKRASNQSLILDAIEAHPGYTGRELASRWLDLDAYEVSKRLSDLSRKGLIFSPSTRVCRVTGRLARTWRVR